MDKVKFECALFDYTEALIKEKGRKPEYGGFKTDVESEDIRLWRPTYTSIELQGGRLFFRYAFADAANGYYCALAEVRIACFDKCCDTGELANLVVIRKKLKEIEKEAEK